MQVDMTLSIRAMSFTKFKEASPPLFVPYPTSLGSRLDSEPSVEKGRELAVAVWALLQPFVHSVCILVVANIIVVW
jgi:hypothetical protein